jgi:hypothetical protein
MARTIRTGRAGFNRGTSATAVTGAAPARSAAVKWNVAADADTAVDPDLAAHQLDETGRDRQSEPGMMPPTTACRSRGAWADTHRCGRAPGYPSPIEPATTSIERGVLDVHRADGQRVLMARKRAG